MSKNDELKTKTQTGVGGTVQPDPYSGYKDYLNTGWKGPQDYSKYGIDFSQEQRDKIAQIFSDQATAAYGTAQNDFSNTMASTQSSLADTIRRSQAQAVATGASRGMQAANELSSMLGLQQTAAQEASKMQGTYAEALANAQKNAYDVQNAANQVGMQGYVADSASNAQMYAAGVDDPYRVFSVAADLRANGQTQAADALLGSYYKGMGYTTEEANAIVGQSNLDNAPVLDSKGNQITGAVEWTPGNDGVIKGTHFNAGFADDANYGDLRNGKAESFKYAFDGKTYSLKCSGPNIDITSNPSLTKALNTISGASNTSYGEIVYYGGKPYINAGKGVWREITNTGDLAYGHSYGEFTRALSKQEK